MCLFFTFTPEARALSVGEPAKTFALKDPRDNIVTLDSFIFNSEITVLEFLSVNCPSCIKKIPLLNEISKKYSDKGVRILGVAIGNSLEEVEGFARSHETAYPIFADPDSITYYLYSIREVPQFFIIDKTGIIRYRGSSKHKGDFEKDLNMFLKKTATTPAIGSSVPQVTLYDISGNPVTISFDDEEKTIIGFFTADDKDNVIQAEKMSLMAEKNRVTGIAFRDFHGKLKSFIDKNSVHFPILIDSEGYFLKGYGVFYGPEIFVVNEAGRIIRRLSYAASTKLPAVFETDENDFEQIIKQRRITELLTQAMPEAVSIEKRNIGNETIFVGIDEQENKFYTRIVKRDILCEVCLDIFFLYTLDQDGIYQNIILINPLEYYGTPIDAKDFTNQFIGNSYHKRFIPGGNVDIISGATYSCTTIIDAINETSSIFSNYTDDPSFDATFRSKICFMHQSSIEWAIHLVEQETGMTPSEITLEDVAHYCPGGKLPVCPSGGQYNIIIFNNIPRAMCTVHGVDPQSSSFSLR